MLEFTTHNDTYIDTTGTHLQGHLTNVTYERLTEVFGEPHDYGDPNKCDANWDILFADGNIGTIYNWKNGKNYCGNYGLDVQDILNWNIGGHKSIVAKRIGEIL
jgi:hypothetical protein